MKIRYLPIILSLTAPAVLALDPVGEPGWSGHINLGAAAGQVESNLLAEIGGFGIDLGDEDLDGFGWKHWIPNLSVAYASEDSDISFYDAKTWIVSAAILRSF